MNRLMPSVALTPGEPAGIGPDLCLQLAHRNLPWRLVAIADPELLESRARQLDIPIHLEPFQGDPQPATPGTLRVLPVPLRHPAHCGRPDPANGVYVLETLQTAVQGCLENRFDAMVTGPVQKSVINAAGIPFTGHTEYLAELTGTDHVVMMLATEGLRVALATTHLPLTQISRAITAPALETTIRVLNQALQERFGIATPRILVCGLNPHAGEGGYLGTEDRDVIEPVINRLNGEGMALQGPLPADTVFLPKYLHDADVVLAMYHDQGLPVLKYAGFGKAINVTLGLPIVRTSVDHGTALELAGTGQANPASFQAAIETAALMSQRRSG